jgi:hypothetical protein
MKQRESQVSAHQLERLRKELHSALTLSVDEHLSDEESIDYVMELLTEDEMARVDAHLASCPSCTAEMEHLYAVSQEWQGETGQEYRAALAEDRLRSVAPQPKEVAGVLQGAAKWLDQLVAELDKVVLALVGPPLKGLHAAAPKHFAPGQTEDGALRWDLHLDKHDNLIIQFGSHLLELEGTLLRLSAANWSQDVVLERKTPDQLGARVVISAEKLEQLPDNAELRVAV